MIAKKHPYSCLIVRNDGCVYMPSYTTRKARWTFGHLQDEEENRHSKYKRCLAMAERCSERFHHYVALSAFSPNKGAIPFYDKKLHNAYRWKYKWLELAEKFKEA